jgi:hypothetical protein
MKIRLALVLFTMTLLASCSRLPSVVLDDLVCDAPCWQGIVVGETSQDEARQIIKQIPELEKESLKSVPQNIIYWRYQGVREYASDLSYQENKIVTLSFAYGQNVTPLKEFIDKFGEPSFVYVISSNGFHYPPMLTVHFIYPEKGVCLHHQPSILSTKAPKNYTISTRTKISLLVIVDPSLPNRQLEVGCLRGLDEDTYNQYVREWTGYGKYEVFVPWHAR